MGNLASALTLQSQEAALVAELQAGSEEAFAWLIAHFHQPIYSLLARTVYDRADAADLTQEVFVKVFKGVHSFHGESSLRTWIYRIALREASNQRRWWMRHKFQEVAIDEEPAESEQGTRMRLSERLVDPAESPFDAVVHAENRARVEAALKQVPEPFRTTLILRDLEGFVYEEVAEIQGVNIGTVKSRLVRRSLFRVRNAPWRGGAMNGCNAMQARFSEYLDGCLNGREMHEIAAHLDECPDCAQEWESLRLTQRALAELGPVAEPRDLLLRIRVAVSQERARSRQTIANAWALAWKNTVGPFLLHASAGFASAVLLLGTVTLLVTMFTQPETAQANTDEPLGNPTAPHLLRPQRCRNPAPG